MDKKSIYGLKPEQLSRLLSIGANKADSKQPKTQSKTNQETTHQNAQGEGVSFSTSGPQIDNYEILGKLGEAGQGQIWRALQISTNRQVALKVPRAGLISSEKALARFEREVELAAGLQHPNIARIHDSGIHQGIYYYAMELIEGVHLDEYAKRHELTIRQILKLVQVICHAIQHAHQKGVIHRDLKPSNIIVSEEGRPFIVDFGLAKNILSDDLNLTVSTDGDTAGTPAYMSPEQASGAVDKLDTRTDVYSLGVILFTLLTGESPHDLSGSRHDVMHRIIHQEVKQPHKICPGIDRELELILLKALDNDPDRRYASAGALAQDVESYLSGAPVQAVPASSVYQLKKFVRRNRALVIGIAAVLAVSMTGAVVSTNFAIRAKHQANISNSVLDLLRYGLIAAASPQAEGQRGSTLESVPDIVVEELNAGTQEPLVESLIRATIGTTYSHLGNWPAAESNLKRAIELRRTALGRDDLETFACMGELGWIYSNKGMLSEAEPILTQAVEGLQTTLDEADPRLLEAISRLAWTYWRMKQPDRAEELQEAALDVVRRRLGPDHLCAPNHMEGLAAAYDRQGRLDEAVLLCEEAMRISRLNRDPNDSETMNITNYLGELYQQLGRHNDAETLFQEVLDVRRKQLGETHPKTLKIVRHLASVYRETKRFGDADRLLTEAIHEVDLEPSGQGGLGYIYLMFDLAGAYEDQSEYDQAEGWFLKAHETANQKFSSDKRVINITINKLIDFYNAWNKPDEAAKWQGKLAQSVGQTEPQQ